MKLKFTKMQGVGNDYIYVDARDLTLTQPGPLATFLADRHFGVGSDGLVILTKSKVADIKMSMFNADGSEGLMCGNAVRCIAKYLIDHNIVAQDQVRIQTKSGVKTVRRLFNNLFSVNLGKPVYDVKNYHGENDLVKVNLGNPHAVMFPKFDLEKFDIARLGRRIEHSPLFPGGVNVEFVKVVGDNVLQMRVWERGSGETLGCGTGACAAAVASVVLGFCDRQKMIKVRLPGGELWVDYRGENVTLVGPAVTVFTGEIEVPEEC